MNLTQFFNVISAIFLIIIWRYEVVTSLTTLRCPKLSINNANVRYAKRNSASARIRCHSTHSLVGNNIIYCYHGRWDGDVPICVTKKPKCKSIESIPNGHIFMPSKYNNAVVSFSCNSGYKLVGADTIYCTTTKWNTILPQCIKSDEKNMETSCNFESPYLCGWTQDINHDFDWRRENFLNTSGIFSYKPNYDHTYGKSNVGYYMYIETVDAQPGDTARLFSPLYNIENFTCFEFYYNMYGSKDGTLQVYLRLESQNVEKIKPIYTVDQHPHHVDEWHRAIIQLPNITESFQIIIEGIRGYSFESNIAIDDVKLLTSCYEEDDYTTGETSTDIYDGLTCAGRCDATEPKQGEKCQCHSNCLESNDCCPDYFHICMIIDESTPTEENIDQSTTYFWTVSTKIFTITTPSTTTSTPTTLSKSQTTKIVPPKATSTTKSQTTNLKPQTTPVVRPKTSTSPPKRQTTMQTTIINRKSSTAKSSPAKPSTTKLSSTTVMNDMGIIPKRFDPEDEPKIDYESQAQEVIIEPETSYHWYIIIFVSSVCSIILIAVVIRYMRNLKTESKKNENWNESATDVRYLTSDEILNFTLATPSKESDLLLENS